MASLVLVTGTDPQALLADAARDYLVASRPAGDDPFASPGTMLVLRQGGLRDDLLRMAADCGIPGWFDPAIAVFSELPARLLPSLTRALSAMERQVVIDDVLRRAAPAILGRPDRLALTVREAEGLLGELSAEGITPEALARASAGLTARDAFQLQRDAEVLAAWQAYGAALGDMQRRDGRDGLWLAAQAIASDPAVLPAALGNRRTLHVVGLMDLRGGWRQLLRSLRAHPALDRVAVYTMHASLLEQVPGLTPDALETVGSPNTLARALFSGGVPDSAATLPAVTVLEAPDDRRALEEVTVAVRALIDAGTAPHRIAVVAREARPFADRAAAALGRLGVPVTMRQRVGLDEVPVVRLVEQLLEAAADEWSRHALVELAEHPYGGGRLDPVIINRLGYERRREGLDAWLEAHANLEARARARDAGAEPDEEERRHPLPDTARVVEARGAFEAFAPFARGLDGERPLGDWLAWLTDFVTADPWSLEARIRSAAADDLVLARADLLGWTRLRATVLAWADVERAHPKTDPLDARAFALAADTLLAGDVVIPVATVHGVVVAEGLSVAYRAFDHLFVLGLETGRFPRKRPAGIVLDDAERDALVAAGVPLDQRSAWEVRERELFRALVAGAGSAVTLAWARTNDDQQEVIVSSFVSEVTRCRPEATTHSRTASTVLVPDFPVARGAAAVARGAFGADIEWRRMQGTGGAHDGAIELPALRTWLAERHGEGFRWSPTSLESLAKCPHAWFSQRLLKLEVLEDPDDDIAATIRGSVLHATLAGFFDRMRAALKRPVFLTDDTVEAALPALHVAFDEAYAEAAAGAWMGAPQLEQARRTEWLRQLEGYVRAEAAEHSALLNASPRQFHKKRVLQTAVDRHEVAFGPTVFTVEGVRFTAAGRMDRIEVGVDERIDGASAYRVIVDYKSSKGAAPGGGKSDAFAEGIVVQAPLYALALKHAEPRSKIARIEYRELKGGEAVLAIKLAQVDYKLGTLRDDPEEQAEEQAKYDASLAAIPRIITRARTGDFPAAPAKSSGCPSWCVAIDTCRVKGGPQTTSW